MFSSFRFVVVIVAFMLAGCVVTAQQQEQDHRVEEVVVAKIPLLGDIPLLGRLFRYECPRPQQQQSCKSNSPSTETSEMTDSVPSNLSETCSIYDFDVKRIDGTATNLTGYKGQVMLIVNVASRCGFTEQYAGLQKLHDTYSGRGLVVLGFPANDFMGQEPGNNSEIAQFCSNKYHVTFPMFEKIVVCGGNIHPLYKYLTEKATDPEFAYGITWNFNKFLIGCDGRIVGRFTSRTAPGDKDVITAIEKELQRIPSALDAPDRTQAQMISSSPQETSTSGMQRIVTTDPEVVANNATVVSKEYFAISAHVEDDPAQGDAILGNGDGRIQKGEAFNLVVVLTNSGNEVAKAITCTVALPPDKSLAAFGELRYTVDELAPSAAITNRINLAMPLSVTITKALVCSIEIERFGAPLVQRWNYELPTDVSCERPDCTMKAGPIASRQTAAADRLNNGDATGAVEHTQSSNENVTTTTSEPNLVPMLTRRESSTVEAKLKRLKELKEAGIVTDDEYVTRRKALVDELLMTTESVKEQKTETPRSTSQAVIYSFSIEGQVKRPGTYNHVGQISLYNALQMAGGVTDFANTKAVIIKRGDEEQAVNIAPIGKNPNGNMPVMDGDVIILSRRMI